MQNLQNDLIELLKHEDNLVVDGHLNKNKIIELALKVEPQLIIVLLKSEIFKKHFFQEVENVLVFDKIKFQRFVNNKSFLPDSYTAFKNKIGLITNDDDLDNFISTSNDVVLAWPHKDCVLEGGQTKEDQKRNEIFWNETLAPDSVDRLLDAKTFTNFKKFDKGGEHKVTEIKGDENLIIKGNNLLALASLLKTHRGKIKLIYIDPPYNTGGDSFNYNDTFNHSTWLTFMKNRLELAKKLLTLDGIIAISIDHSEVFHLKVLMDDIFNRNNFISCITVQNNPKGRVMDKNFSTSNEYLLFYSKDAKFDELTIQKSESDLKKDYPEKDKDGFFRTLELRNTHREFGLHNRPNLYYPFYVDTISASLSLNQVSKQDIEVYPTWNDGFKGCWTWNATKAQLQFDLLEARNINGNWKIFRKSYSRDSDGNAVSKKLKTIWLHKDFHTEKGQKSLDELIGKGEFKAPKPTEYIKTIIDLATNSEDHHIVLDFFAGSGTTAQALMELNNRDGGNRKFILCEQMNYATSTTLNRVKNVIVNGIDNSFVYTELMQYNQRYIDLIQEAKTKDQLINIWNEMQDTAFLSYQFDAKTFNDRLDAFKTAPLEDMKQYLVEVLDKNQLYVNYSEIADATFKVSEEDKKLNKQFYSKK
jgi:adenine-specific DNA-methyltransferase